MKVIVYIWGYITLYPLLTPVVFIPIIWLLRRIFRSVSENLNAFVLILLAAAVMGGATYFNFTHGLKSYSNFLTKNGYETDATVISVGLANSPMSSEKTDEIGILFRDEHSRTFKVAYRGDERRLYPPIPELKTKPIIGDRLRVQFYPQAETTFLVLTDPKKSEYAAKIVCENLQAAIKAYDAQIKFGVQPSADQKQGHRQNIQGLLDANCVSLTDRDFYRGILQTL